MKSITLSQAISILMLAFVASIVPACGGGTSEKLAAGSPIPPPPPTPTASACVTHVSSMLSGPINCPANTTSMLLRTISFVPTNSSDVILYITVEGLYTTTALATGFGFYSIDLQDASGNSLGEMDDSVPNHLPGTNMPLRMNGQPFQFSGNAHFFSEGQFPSAAYTIKLYLTTGNAAISTSNLVVKIVTMEGVTVISPSSNISG